MVQRKVLFNRPPLLDESAIFLQESLRTGHLSGLGPFSLKCEKWLNEFNGASQLLVSSATHALEMMALLADISVGDEVILPSFTFVSTANAFALRGAVLRFADNDEFGNIKISEVERLLNSKTKVVMTVHYAGNSCDMDRLQKLCAEAGVILCEDAAQALGACYQNQPLGTFGALSCYSFHETKNVSSGEGGALTINEKERFFDRAEIIREKGTNRRNFNRGLVDKYTWVDQGSSYLVSDLCAAYLYSQLKVFELMQATRKKIWTRYENELDSVIKKTGTKILPTPKWNSPNYHLFGLILQNENQRDGFISFMMENGVTCPFHYVPLHLSPYIKKHQPTESHENLPGSEGLSRTLVRLPIYYNLTDEDQSYVISKIEDWAKKSGY